MGTDQLHARESNVPELPFCFGVENHLGGLAFKLLDAPKVVFGDCWMDEVNPEEECVKHGRRGSFNRVTRQQCGV